MCVFSRTCGGDRERNKTGHTSLFLGRELERLRDREEKQRGTTWVWCYECFVCVCVNGDHSGRVHLRNSVTPEAVTPEKVRPFFNVF